MVKSVAEGVAEGMRAARDEPSYPSVTQLEDKASADTRQLRKAMEGLIGTEERPFLGGALYIAVTGRTTSEALREVIRLVRDKTPEHDNILQMFVSAGNRTTPGCMVGDEDHHQAARWGSRVVLRELAEAFMCEILVHKGFGRADAEQRIALVRGAVTESSTDALALLLIGSTRNAPRIEGPKVATSQPAAGNGGVGGTATRFIAKAYTQPLPPAGKSGGTMTCFQCHQAGHLKRQCPQLVRRPGKR
ncbi:zinc finger protein, putative [Bodo saltans]|uniref:Zinc finger protein, putative n=1 Tax=Bodo saltans TaxID=75058 RepID=A0A0S4JEI5_BODSA|nr:zinc finger protein, putative [Bodo saltans]|eukprot:CUG88581.1 zinc finger protein, putative [Bodo saltans]